METALVVANVVLVLITAWYAWQTHQTVVEMREARRAVVRPRVCLSLRTKGGHAIVRIENVGSGPALDARATARLITDGETVEQIDWSSPVLRAGESRLLYMPKENSLFEYHEKRGTRVTLSGSCSSAAGETIPIDDGLGFTADMRNEVTVTSSDDVSELLKKIIDALNGIDQSVGSLK